jgi:hypothetical protein
VTSRIPAVIDALVTTWTGLGHTVYDGPNVPTTWPTELIIVGGTENPDDVAVEAAIVWDGLGAKTRRESGMVLMVVIVQSGATTIKTDRDRAFAIFGEFESAVVADPTLGGSVLDGWLLPLEVHYTQRQNDRGSYVRVQVTVNYQSRT